MQLKAHVYTQTHTSVPVECKSFEMAKAGKSHFETPKMCGRLPSHSDLCVNAQYIKQKIQTFPAE